MKFFIDNNLSPRLAAALRESGFDIVYAKDYQMQRASDEEIFQVAAREDRIIISADTDFGFILSQWKQEKPSVILLRGFPSFFEKQLKALQIVIGRYELELREGCILVVERKGVRIRRLPLY